MTKALEAAANALKALGIICDDVIAELEDGPFDPFQQWAADIIRAYAANVTEEMAEECSGEIEKWSEKGVRERGDEWQATPKQIRAAIERGLA